MGAMENRNIKGNAEGVICYMGDFDVAVVKELVLLHQEVLGEHSTQFSILENGSIWTVGHFFDYL